MKKQYIAYFFVLCGVLTTLTLSAQAPSGYYYAAEGKQKAVLKNALHQIVRPIRTLKYGGGEGYTWEGFYSTDRIDDNQVWDMYSDIVRSFDGFSAVSGMHIEHSLPKSWWGGIENDAYRDLFHLYPSDGPTNSSKGNNPLGEVTGTPVRDNGVSKLGKNGFGTDYTGNVFEPADQYKGDFARSYFYVVTAYEELAPLWDSPMMNRNTYPVWNQWSRDLLLKWHRQDPVSEKERARIEQVYRLQGNRNPYIDYPDLVEYIWGKDTLSVYHFPSESGPFLLSPQRGSSLDFGLIFAGTPETLNINVQGVNFTENATLRLKNSVPEFTLSRTSISASEILTGVTIGVEFSSHTSGELRDTLLIESPNLQESLQIPLMGTITSTFRMLPHYDATPVDATVRWVNVPGATAYGVDLFRRDQVAGDLIIASYIEGSSYNKAIRLYNGTGQPIDLSNYYLMKQSNGSGSFVGREELLGILPSGESYVVVCSLCTNDQLLAKKNKSSKGGTDDVFLFNGNDAVGLFRDGVMVDVVGVVDGGANDQWGADVTLVRKAEVAHPSADYRSEQWIRFAIDYFTHLDSPHAMTLYDAIEPIQTDVRVGTEHQHRFTSLLPQQNYTVRVRAYNGGTLMQQTYNSLGIKTDALDQPEVMDASEITSSSLVAHWEPISYADSYLLDLYRLQESGSKSLAADFNNVGSDGKPVPEGFVSTASGNYTSTASSGQSPNSLSFKNAGESLSTPLINGPVTSLSFMGRFASTATGSTFVVEKLVGNDYLPLETIVYLNTLKMNKFYTFDPSTEVVRGFRFTYNKALGNFAFDDLKINYEGFDTIAVQQGVFSQSPSSHTFTALSPLTTYTYRVRGAFSGINSPYSDYMTVTTTMDTSVKNPALGVQILSTHEGVRLIGLQGGERITLYDLSGRLQKQVRATAGSYTFTELPTSSLWLIEVQSPQLIHRFKAIVP